MHDRPRLLEDFGKAMQAHDLRNADVNDLGAVTKTRVMLASRTGAAELGVRQTHTLNNSQTPTLNGSQSYRIACSA